MKPNSLRSYEILGEPIQTDTETNYGWLSRFLMRSLISPKSSAVPLDGGDCHLESHNQPFSDMDTLKKEDLIISDAKTRLSDILMTLSWREIARNYFGKSSSWLYHKLDGIRSDGTPGGGFTPEETAKLKNALQDLADRINKAASSL